MFEMRKVGEYDMDNCGTLCSRVKTIALLGDRWWPQTGRQEGDKRSHKFLSNIWKKGNERANVGGVSVGSSDGAASRKGCVVNGQMA